MSGEGATLGNRRTQLGAIGLGHYPGTATTLTFSATLGLAGDISSGTRVETLDLEAGLDFETLFEMTVRGRPVSAEWELTARIAAEAGLSARYAAALTFSRGG